MLFPGLHPLHKLFKDKCEEVKNAKFIGVPHAYCRPIKFLMGIKDDSKRLEELINKSNTWFWTTGTLLLDADTHDALLDLLQPLV